jgi:hypothetical protein
MLCRCHSDGAVLAVERNERIYLHATPDLLSQKAGALVEYSVGNGPLTSLSWSKHSSGNSSSSKNRLLGVSSSGAAAIITPDSAAPLVAVPPTATEQHYTCGDWSTDGSAVALGAQGGGVAVFTVSSSSSAVAHVLSKEASHPVSDEGVNVVDVFWLADSSTLYVMYSLSEIEDSNAQGTFMRVERDSSSSSGQITALTPVLYDEALCCPDRDNYDKYRLYCAQVSTIYLTRAFAACAVRSVLGVVCVTTGLHYASTALAIYK